jgi:hypothetical protein
LAFMKILLFVFLIKYFCCLIEKKTIFN